MTYMFFPDICKLCILSKEIWAQLWHIGWMTEKNAR